MLKYCVCVCVCVSSVAFRSVSCCEPEQGSSQQLKTLLGEYFNRRREMDLTLQVADELEASNHKVHALTHTRSHTHTDVYMHTHADTYTDKLTRSHTHTDVYMHTHTDTY